MDLNPPAFGGRKTCKDTVCYRRPTLNSPQEWLMAGCAAFRPLTGHLPSSANLKQLGQKHLVWESDFSLESRELAKCLPPLSSKLGFSQPSLPVRMTGPPYGTALILYKYTNIPSYTNPSAWEQCLPPMSYIYIKNIYVLIHT